jgi:hypothetical protein
MRLTLRTLLAHLDKTLEAADDATIAAKLRESEFAATLVRRISACIASEQLNAPSPVSTSTADDPNRIGEYLDSVLSSEQVAEIERICLESDVHLAEVAACHQILTIVLGNPAEVAPSLRARIYDIGQGPARPSTNNLLTNGIPAGTVRRAQATTGAVGGDAISRALAAEPNVGVNPTMRATSVAPVGPDDSGVSDAPTRLRSFPAAKSTVASQPAIAGSRPMDAAEASEIFGRPSRVVPWLVSLALAASFLFVVGVAFKPLFRKDRLADKDSIVDSDKSDSIGTEPEDAAPTLEEVDAEHSPPMVDLDPGASETPTEEPLLPPVENGTDVADPEAESMEESLPPPMASVTTDEASPDELPAPEEALPPASDLMPPAESEMAADVSTDDSEAEAPAAPAEAANSRVVASFIGDNSLLMMRKPTDAAFMLVKKDATVDSASQLICPPLYRDRLSMLGQVDMTIVGPARVQLSASPNDTAQINVNSGRVLLSPWIEPTLSPTDDDSQIGAEETGAVIVQVVFGDSTHELTFGQPDAVAAIEVEYVRPPGTDPEDATSVTSFIKVLAVKGQFDWKTMGTPSVSVATGEELRWSPTEAATKNPTTSIPTWIEPSKPVPGSIESSARDGLLALVRGNESIELSLREAIDFRRAEVGALAAQTLLLLESPDCYFGVDGIFSDVKQKAFWPDHFAALVSKLDQGAESAAIVREAVNQMDAAEADVIFRLLWLFSNAQLEAGADEVLVKSLDSSNMTVRVLGAENLRRITGTTLFYKPENNTAPRRASDIKKWETRLKKRDIRWADAAPAVNAVPAVEPAPVPSSEAPATEKAEAIEEVPAPAAKKPAE